MLRVPELITYHIDLRSLYTAPLPAESLAFYRVEVILGFVQHADRGLTEPLCLRWPGQLGPQSWRRQARLEK